MCIFFIFFLKKGFLLLFLFWNNKEMTNLILPIDKIISKWQNFIYKFENNDKKKIINKKNKPAIIVRVISQHIWFRRTLYHWKKQQSQHK